MLKDHEAIGAPMMHLAMKYLIADCNPYPVFLTFKPFDDRYGPVRQQLRREVVRFSVVLQAFLARHGYALDFSERDLLIMGTMSIAPQLQAITPRPVANPTCALAVCLPMPEQDDQFFDQLVNKYRSQLLGACQYVSDIYVDCAYGDCSVDSILEAPFDNGLVSATDIIFITQETADHLAAIED